MLFVLIIFREGNLKSLINKIKYHVKKILNEQTEEPQGRFQTIRKKCDTHFAFSEVDTYKHTSYDRDGQSIYIYIDCPKCSYSIMAEKIMKPNRSNGIFGVSFGQTEQKILNTIDVSALRATVTDNEFKRMLIKQLS